MKASTGHRSPHYPDTTSEEWERGYAAGSRAETGLLIAGLCFTLAALAVVVAWAPYSLGVL